MEFCQGVIHLSAVLQSAVHRVRLIIAFRLLAIDLFSALPLLPPSGSSLLVRHVSAIYRLLFLSILFLREPNNESLAGVIKNFYG